MLLPYGKGQSEHLTETAKCSKNCRRKCRLPSAKNGNFVRMCRQTSRHTSRFTSSRFFMPLGLTRHHLHLPGALRSSAMQSRPGVSFCLVVPLVKPRNTTLSSVENHILDCKLFRPVELCSSEVRALEKHEALQASSAFEGCPNGQWQNLFGSITMQVALILSLIHLITS